MKKLWAFYRLTKPGIVQGNALHTLAGALLASVLPIQWGTVVGVVVGTSLVVASACVANNYMDRGIDSRMKRTRKRPSVTGEVSLPIALVYAVILLGLGFWALFVWTNLTVMVIGLVAYVMYVFVYGWAKRTTVHSTVIGAVPGALPAMAGYVAVTGEVTFGAWLVFLLIFTWQMPHFYAISLFRKDDYKQARLPVLGVVRPFEDVRRHTLIWLVLYLVSIMLIISTGIIGVASSFLLLVGAAYWMVVFYRSETNDIQKWARSVFGASLVLTILLLVAALLNLFVPPLM